MNTRCPSSPFRCAQHALVAGLPGHPGGEVEAAAPDRRRGLCRDRRHRRAVDVAPVDRVRRVVPEPGTEQLDAAVVERAAHRAARPPSHHSCDQLGQALGLGGGEVVALRGGPRRGGTAPSGSVSKSAPWVCLRHRLPLARRRAPGSRPSRSTAAVLAAGAAASARTEANECPVTGSCSTPRYTSGAVDAEQLVDGRGDVGHVDELVALRAALVASMPAGPVHDHRDVDPALVGVLLVPLERRVAALRPAPRVVGVAVRAADVVDPVDRLVGRLEDAVEELHLVHHAEGPALLRGAVVGQHDRIVSSSSPSARRPSTRRPIWSSVWSRNAANASCSRAASRCWFSGSVVPRLDAGVARRQLGAFGDHAELELALVPALAHHVPALVERARGTWRGTPAGAWWGAWVAPKGR